MALSTKIFVGIDIGSSNTKICLLNAQKKVIGFAVKKTGANHDLAVKQCLSEALTRSHIAEKDLVKTVATGYGRKNVPFADIVKTEISCHAKGCYFFFPESITIVDIGGQDNKVIKLDKQGKLINFKMNRKCAAGTGAFLEEMASRLDISLDKLNNHAQKSLHMVELGSFCTVFSATEVLSKIAQGEKIEDIVKGIFHSVIKRILEMDTLAGTLVMTGGVVAFNPFLITMIKESFAQKVLVPTHPLYTGALGAALYAIELHYANSQ